MVSTSKPMPLKGTDEDADVQPPHRQAGNYYKGVARRADGSFKVTMESPSTARPKPLSIEITGRGAQFLTVSAVAGAAATGEKQKAEIDDLLDEIDDVLETNAEDFVKSYVQKGGQ